ncbi:MAG: GSCFA domain-containing protein [Bacteroidales bacterium]|nr:GSCFA domain-containing protein [Bacteroidales bacterium]
MIKLSTNVVTDKFPSPLSLGDKITVLGSCFADEMGIRMRNAGFNVCVNPFGTLYNPISIANSIARLDHCIHFRPDECVEMGAGAGKICSWAHHTSFARATADEFLANANKALEEASIFWKESNKVVITLGTAMVWKRVEGGEVVSNCLKRPAAEFSHEMLPVEQMIPVLRRMVSSHPDKEFIFTVSPIRHMGGGAHVNSLSKASLLLALDAVGVQYFPAYEIMMDELRDYRFYAEDLVHPSKTAADLIWERFLEAAVRQEDLTAIQANEKKAKAAAHRQKE